MDTKDILKFMHELNHKSMVAFINGDKERWLRYQMIIELLEEELKSR